MKQVVINFERRFANMLRRNFFKVLGLLPFVSFENITTVSFENITTANPPKVRMPKWDMNIEYIKLKDGDQSWHKGDKLHRLDGPAVVRANGDQEWWVEGKKHRTDGPAVINQNNAEYWWKGRLDSIMTRDYWEMIRKMPIPGPEDISTGK